MILRDGYNCMVLRAGNKNNAGWKSVIRSTGALHRLNVHRIDVRQERNIGRSPAPAIVCGGGRYKSRIQQQTSVFGAAAAASASAFITALVPYQPPIRLCIAPFLPLFAVATLPWSRGGQSYTCNFNSVTEQTKAKWYIKARQRAPSILAKLIFPGRSWNAGGKKMF